VKRADIGEPTDGRRLSICLISPKLPSGFHGFEFALPILGYGFKAAMAPPALPALAALVPAGHDIVLMDENVEPVDIAALHRFDIVGITGMLVQVPRMLEILSALVASEALIVVGGPAITVDESVFEGLCDVRFINEAEETWPAFVNAVANGEPIAPRYQQADKTDMTKVPVPRFDLLQRGVYWRAAVQFSRGCPFLCEFCDIITQLGRRPRLKTPQQVLAEFDAVHRAGFSSCFLVDDNFIANKVQAKVLLRALIDWQRERGYPLRLTTQVSINLADDRELMQLMAQAIFSAVFIGIESPRTASLVETRKNQNVRGDGMLDKVRRVRDHGMVVLGGFIVGFDSDDAAIFDEQFEFIEQAGIAQATVGILQPIPSTPLYDRLKSEGRLDGSVPGIEYRPRHMSREQLLEGYDGLIRRLYEPRAYFGRLYRGYCESAEFRRWQAQFAGRQSGWGVRLKTLLGTLPVAFRLARALRLAGQLGRLSRAYVGIFARYNLPLGRDGLSLQQFVSQCVQHWHFVELFRRKRMEIISATRPVVPMARRRYRSPLSRDDAGCRPSQA
jgi:radical SAM superfamily enzyme YgiQ (UPF0313 family)